MRIRSTDNAAGLLQTIEADRGTGSGWEAVLSNCVYNARGQLIHQTFGNGASTDREYDPDIERLVRIFTEHSGQGLGLQDLRYTYDPVGNPLAIEDALTNPTYSANQPIPNTRGFHYDARYRLVRATGRKLKSVGRKDLNPYAPAPSEQDYEPYDYRYRYDEVGNFTKNHEYSGGQLHYKDGRRDLFNGDGKEAIDGDPKAGNWTYDANGNATRTPRHQELAYTHDNQARYVDMGGGTEVRYFRHGDQRVLKFVRKNGVKALGVYLGPWEYHERTGVNARAKVVLHVDGHGRHAQAEVVLDGADSESLPWFFVHADHLGSGHILTKSDGSLLSQEEYFPYGRASDRRDIRNRYRFIGVEQDEETGLCMTGPRTYDPVTGRFLQGDPIAATRGGLTPFHYASGNPVGRSDPGGYAEMPQPQQPEAQICTPNNPTGQVNASPPWPETSAADMLQPPDQGPQAYALDPNAPRYPSPQEQFERDIQTLQNMSGGLGGAVGFLAAGERGSDLGAYVDRVTVGAYMGRALRGGPPQLAAGRGEGRPLPFFNRFPSHDVGPPLQTFTAQQVSRLTFNRRLNYVVTEGGALRLGRINSTQIGGGHIDLAGGAPVLAAGEVSFRKGQIHMLDNASGHYLPSGPRAQGAAESAFRQVGLNPGSAYVEKVWNGNAWVPK